MLDQKNEPVTGVPNEPVTGVSNEPVTGVRLEPTSGVRQEPTCAVTHVPELPQVPQPKTMGFHADVRRHPSLNPGSLLYSAQIDDESIHCFYCSHFQCLANRELAAARTFLDVYSNAVVMNTPRKICFGFFQCDNTSISFYDQAMFRFNPVKGGCCTPSPYLCTHCCNCCGETLVFRGGNCGFPRFNGHCSPAIFFCFCPLDIFIGLRKGESEKVIGVVHSALQTFRDGAPKPRYDSK